MYSAEDHVRELKDEIARIKLESKQTQDFWEKEVMSLLEENKKLKANQKATAEKPDRLKGNVKLYKCNENYVVKVMAPELDKRRADLYAGTLYREWFLNDEVWEKGLRLLKTMMERVYEIAEKRTEARLWEDFPDNA